MDDSVSSISVLKITALWAFSESAFGGILHAISVPFRGIFISSAAVLFISLLALFSKNKNEILKSTLIVLLVKLLVSPHTPLTAYFAVTVQGILGYLLFLPKNIYRLSAFILGILSLFFSGIQKIVVLTLVFGNTLWKSLNIFIQQVSMEFLSLKLDLQFGYFLITLYVSIHLSAGIFIGYYAGKLPVKINRYKYLIPNDLLYNNQDEFPLKHKRKKKNWFLRPTGIIIIFISISVLIYSYLYPHSLDIGSNDIVVMLIRSVVITLIWFSLIGPFITTLFHKYLEKKKSSYSKEINYVIDLFPQFKNIVSYCWINSSDKTGIKRIRKFLSTSFYYLLLS